MSQYCDDDYVIVAREYGMKADGGLEPAISSSAGRCMRAQERLPIMQMATACYKCPSSFPRSWFSPCPCPCPSLGPCGHARAAVLLCYMAHAVDRRAHASNPAPRTSSKARHVGLWVPGLWWCCAVGSLQSARGGGVRVAADAECSTGGASATLTGAVRITGSVKTEI
jgi:hypothetical protein